MKSALLDVKHAGEIIIFDKNESPMHVIQRCVKPPGFIFAARTYRLVLNDKGLYLIHIGRAMGPKVYSNSATSNAIAHSMIGKMERKLMVKLAEREEGIDDSNLDKELPLSKKSRFFAKPAEVQLSFDPYHQSGARLKLKGKGVRLNLQILPGDIQTVQLILQAFSK